MKPGLYVATVRGVEGVIVIGPSSEDHAYRTSETINGLYYHEAPQVTDARPLVVLDPESDEDRECLRAAMSDACPSSGQSVSLTRAAGAILSALAAPTPAEPMGLGAMVRDRAGDLWMRSQAAYDGDPLVWMKSTTSKPDFTEWASIQSPEVLSEGWSA